jgi:hypothetical protein
MTAETEIAYWRIIPPSKAVGYYDRRFRSAAEAKRWLALVVTPHIATDCKIRAYNHVGKWIRDEAP